MRRLELDRASHAERSRDELGRLQATFNLMLAKVHGGLESYSRMRTGMTTRLVGQIAAATTTLSAASQEMAAANQETGRAVDRDRAGRRRSHQGRRAAGGDEQ